MRAQLQRRSSTGRKFFWLRWTEVRRATCAAVLAVSGGSLSAADDPAPAAIELVPVRRTITTIREFWALAPAERPREHRFVIECDVTYFDPIWRNLWVQDREGRGEYVFLGEELPPVKAGDRVRVSGVFRPPNNRFSFDGAEFTVVGRAAPVVQRAPDELAAPEVLNHLVELDAFVVQQELVDAQHLQLTLSIGGRPVFGWVLIDGETTVPSFVDARVRLRAVIARPPEGGSDPRAVELKIARLSDIEQVTWLGSDPRFELPLTPIEALAELPRDRLVRVAGELKAQEPGRYVRLRDATGQVEVRSAQTRTLTIGERVQAIGYPRVDGIDWTLEAGLFRPAGAVAAQPNLEIRVAAGVIELLPEEAVTARPVRLSGVVTWSAPGADYFFLQDATGGVCVYIGDAEAERPPVGRNARVIGTTAIGNFAPVVTAAAIVNLGNLVLPAARPATLESALTGVEEAQWVEMRGYLRRFVQEDGKAQLEITTAAGAFTAEISGDAELAAHEGAVIRLRGVCTAMADERRKLTGIRLLVPSAVHVQVEEAAPDDWFALPARRLANLGQFGTLQLFNRRVKIAGVVLHHAPGRFVQIEEGGESLFVMSRQEDPLAPGDRVEAVGLLGRLAGSPVLREAVYRRTGAGPPPEPLRLDGAALTQPEFDGRLVRVEATLLDTSRIGSRLTLALQERSTLFEAYLEGATEAAEWRVGSRLALTGIYETKYAEGGHTGVFQIRLRSPADLAVLATPSPLTRERVLSFAAALAAGVLLCVAWVVALRRRVRRQTEQIREQMERERRLEAELQRAAKLESLGLLAGGIAHDFNNLLTIVMGNLSLASLDLPDDNDAARCLREAERAVARARDLTQQLLTFAKGGAPLRSAVKLEEIVREVAQFTLRGSKVRCVFDIPADLWPAEVDKGQIGQVVQNITINAQQAMPAGGALEIALRNVTVRDEFAQVLRPGRYVQVSVADHGPGIPPEHLAHVFDPYFTTKKEGHGLGLATVHSIVKKHHGHITVESGPGGTTFRIWLPAAAEARIEPSPEPAKTERMGGRVLFMDDDAEIRALGTAILKRLGYETTAVEDGGAAVREYCVALERGARFDVVILDLTVPGGMGGRETIEALLKIDPTVRAIVSSGYSNDTVMADFRRHGFCGIVSKPYEVANLAEALRQAVRR